MVGLSQEGSTNQIEKANIHILVKNHGNTKRIQQQLNFNILHIQNNMETLKRLKIIVIRKILMNFKKDSSSRKTKDYINKRLDALSDLWGEQLSNAWRNIKKKIKVKTEGTLIQCI